jgi:threonine/homoserine/homoserine lactone efflux protein
MLRSRGGSLSAPQGESGTGGYSARSVLLAFLVAVTNPKGYLFCSALLPQFIDPTAAQAPQYIAIARYSRSSTSW